MIVDTEAAMRFLRTAYEPDDWIALFLKSYETGRPCSASVRCRFSSNRASTPGCGR